MIQWHFKLIHEIIKHYSFVMHWIFQFKMIKAFCCFQYVFLFGGWIVFLCFYRKGEALPEGVTVDGSTLHFSRPLLLTDQGDYICTTTNVVGSGRAEISISISGVYHTENPSVVLKWSLTHCCHLVKILCNCVSHNL